MARRYLTFICALVAWVSILAVAQASAITMVAEKENSGYKLYSFTPDGTFTYLADGFSPAVSHDGTKIAYTGSGGQLMVMDSDGDNAAQVGSLYGADAAWSPDDTELVYGRYGQTYITDLSGSNHVVGHDSDTGNYAWSPDGDSLAYTMHISSRYEIRVIAADGDYWATSSALTDPGSGYGDDSPQWSQDGKYITFSSNRSGRYEVYEMESDGDNITQLTNSPYPWFSQQSQYAAGSGALYFLKHTDSGGNNLYLHEMSSEGGGDRAVSTDVVWDLSIQQPILPTVPSSGAHYVALGDSVASGEGINYGWTWDEPTETWLSSVGLSWLSDPYSSSGYDCHQSASAYPQLLADDLTVDPEDFGDFACTGAAAMDGVLTQQDTPSTSAPQLGKDGAGYDSPNSDYDTNSPDLVTLTLGADDINFAKFVSKCSGFAITGFTCDDSSADTQLVEDLSNQASSLHTVLEEIRARGVDNEKIPLVILTDYYDPFPASYDSSCTDLNLSSLMGTGWVLTSGEMDWIRGYLHILNANIARVASEFDNVILVSAENLLSGHTLCSEDPWVYGPSLRIESGTLPYDNGNPAPYHLTADGQLALEARVLAAVG